MQQLLFETDAAQYAHIKETYKKLTSNYQEYTKIHYKKKKRRKDKKSQQNHGKKTLKVVQA